MESDIIIFGKTVKYEKNHLTLEMYTKMKKLLLLSFVIIIAVMSCTACTDNGNSSLSENPSEISQIETPDVEELKRNIVGEWGRNGEVMHIFYNDGQCEIGGVSGTYKIDDSGNLIMITQGGTQTEYIWEDMTQTNFWNLSEKILAVNGNEFQRCEQNE